MACNSRDLTIESALADPMIAAARRADRIDAGDFEHLLRATAKRLDGRRDIPAPALAVLAERGAGAITGAAPRW